MATKPLVPRKLLDPVVEYFKPQRVILFGSRARGEAREDSDYDVAVFLRDYAPGTSTELYRLADLGADILDKTGAFVHAMPYPAGSYNDPRMPLMYAIRTEGIDL